MNSFEKRSKSSSLLSSAHNDSSTRNPGKADLAKLSKAIEAGKLPANARFALQTPVMVGELENNLYPVSKGLSSNATVITTNLLNLKHGMPVQVQTGATPN